jgi:hypothetical protein
MVFFRQVKDVVEALAMCIPTQYNDTGTGICGYEEGSDF